MVYITRVAAVATPSTTSVFGLISTGTKKTLHCPKQLERSNDVYEDLATRGEHTLNYYGDYLIFLSSKKCYNEAYRVVRKE